MRHSKLCLTTGLVVLFAVAVASAQPASFTDLGTIGSSGTYTFDTDGSLTIPDPMSTEVPFSVDTELSLYDDAGNLIAENDDNGGGGLWSLITENLGAGMYFLGISEFDSIWEPNYVNSGSSFEPGEMANLVLNIDSALAGSADAGGDGTNLPNTVWFKVGVVPEPASGALLTTLGIVGLFFRRRR